MAGSRLCTQIILLLSTLLVSLIGLKNSGLYNYFTIPHQPSQFHSIGSDVFDGISTTVLLGECLLSNDNIASSKLQKYGLSTLSKRAIDGDTSETLWRDSERPEALWIYPRSINDINSVLGDIFKYGVHMHGCSRSSCATGTYDLAGGFSRLNIHITLATETGEVFESSIRRVESCTFALHNALRVFEDVYSINVLFRVVRNAQWAPFLVPGVASEEEKVFELTTDAMKAVKRGFGAFPLDKLTAVYTTLNEGVHGRSGGQEECGVDCRDLHLIMYQAAERDTEVRFPTNGALLHGKGI